MQLAFSYPSPSQLTRKNNLWSLAVRELRAKHFLSTELEKVRVTFELFWMLRVFLLGSRITFHSNPGKWKFIDDLKRESTENMNRFNFRPSVGQNSSVYAHTHNGELSWGLERVLSISDLFWRVKILSHICDKKLRILWFSSWKNDSKTESSYTNVKPFSYTISSELSTSN